MFLPTQAEYNATKLGGILDIKINLLNYNYQKVDELSGVLLPSSTCNISSSTPLRRSCNLSLIVTDSSFDIKEGNKIWLDKYIEVLVGIKNQATSGEFIYRSMGIYLINNPSQVYASDDNRITISGLDLMAKLTGLRNGNLEGLPHIVPQNSNVRSVIISTLALAGFYKYVIEECPFSVPNDINIDVGGTVWEILNELNQIDSSYEMYFDTEGVFHYNKIPTGENEQITISDDLWERVLIEYSVNTDFESVKNIIEVFGKTHDIKNYSTSTTISGSNYLLTIPSVTSLYDNLKIGFTPTSTISGSANIKINSLTAYPLRYENGTIPMLDSNVYYVAKFMQNGNYFLFMGEVTSYGIAIEENPDSPFSVDGTFGEVRIVLKGDDYDNIYTSDLARQRAEFELYTRCKLQDSVNLIVKPIYWLDVNQLIEITLPNKQGNIETREYLVKEVNTTLDVSGTQTIKLMRYYPLYPSL